jgi:hypothetical protein
MALLPSVAAGSMHGAIVPIGYFTGNGASQASFTNIPQIYQDLRVVIYGRSGTSAATQTFSFYVNNNQNNTSYSETDLYGNGASALSLRNTTGYGLGYIIPAATSTSGIFGSITIDILNYANTTTYKTILARQAFDLNGSGSTYLSAGFNRTNTNAITQLDVVVPGALISGSTVALYGVRTVNQ